MARLFGSLLFSFSPAIIMADTAPSHPQVHLVIVFRAASEKSSKSKAEHQYLRLIETLTNAGLKAVGKRAKSAGQILVFVTWAQEHFEHLMRRERYVFFVFCFFVFGFLSGTCPPRQADFLSGLPVTPVSRDSLIGEPSPADKIRLVHDFISSCPSEGGLGVSPGSFEWDLVESITPLHDPTFNEIWVRSWKPFRMTSVELNGIRDQVCQSQSEFHCFSLHHLLVW